MYSDVIMAGFGGQGIMLIGKILAYTGMKEGRHVVWIPSYGPEMRGGTANCTVVVSDKPIASPVIANPDSIVVMNKPSLDKFETWVKEGGTVVINETLIDRKTKRKDVHATYLPANKIAMELGTAKAANMVMLGAYVALTKVISKEGAIEGIKHSMANKEKFIPINLKAFNTGYDLASK